MILSHPNPMAVPLRPASPRTCSGVRALAFPRKAKIVFGEHNLARTHRAAITTPAYPAETWMPEQVRHDGNGKPDGTNFGSPVIPWTQSWSAIESTHIE